MSTRNAHPLLIIATLILTLPLVACSARQLSEPTPTATEPPTDTPSPTDTPAPTPTDTPTPSPTPTPTPTPTPMPLSEWTEQARIMVTVNDDQTVDFSVASFCALDPQGKEHKITLGTCEAEESGRPCAGLCSETNRPLQGGSMPMSIDGECTMFLVGPAFDPETFELGGGAQVTLWTESASSEDGYVIVLEFLAVPCE